MRGLVKVGHNGGKCGRNDRLVESSEEHPEHQRADNDQHAAATKTSDWRPVGPFCGLDHGSLVTWACPVSLGELSHYGVPRTE